MWRKIARVVPHRTNAVFFRSHLQPDEIDLQSLARTSLRRFGKSIHRVTIVFERLMRDSALGTSKYRGRRAHPIIGYVSKHGNRFRHYTPGYELCTTLDLEQHSIESLLFSIHLAPNRVDSLTQPYSQWCLSFPMNKGLRALKDCCLFSQPS